MNTLFNNEKETTQTGEEYAKPTTSPKIDINQETEKKGAATTTPKVKPDPGKESKR